MKVAAYARYSTENQTENSIAAQLDAIIKFCQANNHTITATFIDEARSGTNTQREGFQQLLQGAQRRDFEGVVIYDISRGSRDVADWFNFRKEMQLLKIKVICATENLGDLSNPNDFLVELINVGLGQHMVLQTRQKSIAGVAVKANQGVFLGGYPPLGYDAVDGKYVVNTHEAAAVKTIFEMYADGGSYKQIIEKLAAQGYKGKRGRPIGKNSLHSILTNERYIGVYSWNKRTVKYMGKWAGGAANPHAVRIENAITPLIDMRTWERVQERMKSNKRAQNSAKYTYLLSGLVVCGECGAAYTGRTTVNGKNSICRCYACGNKYRTRTCKAKNVNADELETAIVNELINYLKKADYSSAAEQVYNELQKIKSPIKEQKQELAKLKTQLSNCVKSIRNGLDFPELRDEIDDLRQQIDELEHIVSTSSEVPIDITKEQIAAKIKKDAENINFDDIPRLIKTYINKVYIHSDKIVVTGGVHFNGCGDGI